VDSECLHARGSTGSTTGEDGVLGHHLSRASLFAEPFYS
jgi:hypothetical protein